MSSDQRNLFKYRAAGSSACLVSYVLIFSHLELVHCHSDAQLLLPSAPDRDATVSTAGRPCAEGHSENEDQQERGGHAERETFSPNLGQPYVVHPLPAQLTRACVCAITLSLP